MEDVHTTIPACGQPASPRIKGSEEACSVQLSENDAAAVLAASEHPPEPNEAALRAARRFLQHHD